MHHRAQANVQPLFFEQTASIPRYLVIGEPEELEPYSRQLILNPCAGHPARKRNIHDRDFVETLREYAALDGAFRIDRKGVVHSAGTYLDARSRSTRIPRGLGARHMAAAAITAVTPAVWPDAGAGPADAGAAD